MEKRILIPDTDLSVYPIGLGTVDAGLRWDGPKADRIFDTYVYQGGNLIDCAHVYSDWVPGEIARAERVLGDWLARSKKRNEVVIMTKGGHPDMTAPVPDMHKSRMTHDDMVKDLNESLKQLRTDYIDIYFYHRDNQEQTVEEEIETMEQFVKEDDDMVKDLNESLKQLRTDYIDIYFYHRDNQEQTVEEEIETMEQFVKEGKIRYYGCSNWDAERMIQADAYCKEKGYRGFVADQSLLNLGMKYMRPLADDTLGYIKGEVFDYHIKNAGNLAMPYMANCSGFFHIYDRLGMTEIQNNPYYTPENMKIAEGVKTLKEKYHCSITQVVLGFFYHQPFPCVPLYGTTKAEHIVDACGTLDIPFTAEDYEELLK